MTAFEYIIWFIMWFFIGVAIASVILSYHELQNISNMLGHISDMMIERKWKENK